ncbi:MAG: folate-binding protein [Gammaproteobacteria bacterium]|jgi:folate-binding protein YgfZ|nr:folate-binding protein [Gammaproteobacteria bacterium]
MRKEWNLSELGDLGVLRVRGADAVGFLQGQVSNDVARLTPQQSLLAGYHNPQGRAIALLRLVQLEQDDLLAILPRELAATVASRLSKFVLRAKVKVADESASWRVTGLAAPPQDMSVPKSSDADAANRGASVATGSGAADPGLGTSTAQDSSEMSWAAAQFERASALVSLPAGAKAATPASMASDPGVSAAQLDIADATISLPDASALILPDVVGAQSRVDDSVVVRVGAAPPRWLMISPAQQTSPLAGVARADRDAWRRLDIAAGQPQIYAATSEEFVAQMLNLDALDAIAFDKGCYTGQEVIARAHYRGRVKRRLQRFVSRGALRLAPGDSSQLADGRAFKVVEAVQLADGRCEFLAVAPLAWGNQEPPTVPAAPSATPPQSTPVEAEQLALPYTLPD